MSGFWGFFPPPKKEVILLQKKQNRTEHKDGLLLIWTVARLPAAAMLMKLFLHPLGQENYRSLS